MCRFFGWFDDDCWCGLAGWPAELDRHVVRESCVETLDPVDVFALGGEGGDALAPFPEVFSLHGSTL